ncbi:MAG: pilus assembly protein PilM [Zoogloeaceae bacterium]|jgi:type IV pilus assembly protein PilM|nr:pilus assembly protein PilM [Zoogloeaceae bacterium]
MRLELSLPGKKMRPSFGLDVCSSAVKMLELSRTSKGEYRVDHYVVEPLPKDAVVDGRIAELETVSQAVQRALKRMGTATRHCVMALPASAVITKKITIPDGLRDDELDALMESEAHQHIPFAIEEVNFDYQVLGPAKSAGELDVLLAASKKEGIEDRLAVAEAAGLKVQVMDVETYAIQAAWRMVMRQLPLEAQTPLAALVNIGTKVMRFTVMRGEDQIYVREQPFGGERLTQEIVRAYGVDFNQADTNKRTGNLPADYRSNVLDPFLDSLALEAQRALQLFFTSTQYDHIDNLVLSGGTAQIEGIERVVADKTGVHTLIANPFTGMVLPERVHSRSLAADAPSLMIACGLALRRFDPS